MNPVYYLRLAAIQLADCERCADDSVATEVACEQQRIHHEVTALLFTAHKVREAGEVGTERMAQFIESLIVNLRDAT